jgi:hypothetical protein
MSSKTIRTKRRGAEALLCGRAVESFRPWIFLLTGGLPTDDAASAAEAIRDGEASKSLERDYSDFCGEARGRTGHAASSQRVGHGGGDCCDRRGDIRRGVRHHRLHGDACRDADD